MTSDQRAPGDRRYLRQYWLNWRRIRFWVVAAVLLYAGLGFFALPWLIRDTAVRTMAEDYGRDLSIDAVRVNPFLFSVEIEGLTLDDVDGEALASFDRLLVDFTPLSLFHWAWTFETAHLDGLTLNGERFKDGQTRIARLVADLTPRASDNTQPAEEPTGDAAGGIRLIVQSLRLTSGRLTFVDHVPPEPVSVVLDPVSIDLNDLDTRAGREGRQTVDVAFGDGGLLHWSGSVQLDPLRSAGRIDLQGVVLDAFLPYLQQFADLSGFRLSLDAGFDYEAGLAGDTPRLSVSDGAILLSDLSVSGFDPAVEILSVSAVRAEDISYEHDGMKTRIGTLRVEQPAFTTWLTENGEPALLSLLRESSDAGDAGTASPGDAGGPKPATDLQIDAFRVVGLAADFEDRSLPTPARFGLRDADLAVDAFTTADAATFPVRLTGTVATGGQITLDGKAGYQPDVTLDAGAKVEGLTLAPAEPYLRRFARVRLHNGEFNLDGRIRLGKTEPFAYTGATRVDALDVRTEAGDLLLSWAAVGVDELDVSLAEARIASSPVTLDKPAATVVIAEDRSTNIGRLLVDQPRGGTPSDASSGTEDRPFDVTLGGIKLKDARLDFADHSLPLPFSTRVSGLNGQASTLATGSTEPARIDLEGQVGEYGLARIDGSLNPRDPLGNTDVHMEFRNLAMPEYSPYTVQFAGRRIANGRMDLDLAYRIEQGKLHANNDIVLRDLTLGEKLEGVDAPNLPLGLAVALLKDADGVIDIALPVSGDINDPQFAIGGVIRKAFTDLIKDLVRSPFRALGSLLGLGGGDLGRIEFLPGRSDLTPPEREQIGKLAGALRKRPQLALKIPAAYAPALDRPALQERRALDALRDRLEAQTGKASDLTLTDKAALPALRALFVAAYPDADLDAEREEFAKANGHQGNNGKELDEVAWQAHLARRVIAAQSITDADLATLANARADAVRSELLAGGTGSNPIGKERIEVLPAKPVEIDNEGGNRIPLKLGVDAR